jgi:hypothetical protein
VHAIDGISRLGLARDLTAARPSIVEKIIIVAVAGSVSSPRPRRDAEANFFGVAGGVEGEEAGEDFLAEIGGPEQATLVGLVVLALLVEEARLGALREIMPAIGFEHGVVQGGVQLTYFHDLCTVLARIVELVIEPRQTHSVRGAIGLPLVKAPGC